MKRALATLVLSVLCVLGIVAVGGADPEPVESRVVTVETRVRVAEIERAPGHRIHRFHGVTRPADRAVLAFPVGGRVVERSVEVGSAVVAGEVLATLDAAPFRNQVDAALAQLDELDARLSQVQRERERAQLLLDAQIGNAQALDQLSSEREALTAARRAAEAQLAEARRQRGETSLQSPLSGTVSEVFVNAGEVVGPGAPVAAIAGAGLVEVEFDVPESVFSRITEGQSVRVDLPLSGGRTAQATISGVSRSAASRGRLYPVVARLDDASVAPGMAAAVDVALAEPEALLVPIGAVVDPSGGSPTVFVIREGLAVAVEVSPLGLVGDGVRVQGDLREGELVAVSGLSLLSAGDAVEVAR